MPSSISSSNDRLPAPRWRRVWVAAVALVGLVVGGWELFWRSRGFVPSVTDDPLFWAVTRRKLDGATRPVAVVGGSRALVGIDPGVIERRAGGTAAQLAIDGNWGIPVLEHLAADPSFRGVVLLDLMEEHLRGLAIPAARQRSVPEQYIDAYEKLSWSKAIERDLRTRWQLAFASRSPVLSVQNLTSAAIRGRLPAPPGMRMGPDRDTRVDYALTNAAAVRQAREEIIRSEYARQPPMTVAEFLAGADRLEAMIVRIQSRGGRVVIVRMPTTGVHWELDEARHPKRQYWDALAGRTAAETVHFLDHPPLAHYDCPDGSHLDARDAPTFTAALVDVVRPTLSNRAAAAPGR